MPVVYMDVLIAVNWFVNYWLLNATACVLRLSPKHGRIVVSALIGAVGGGLLFVCRWPLLLIIVCHLCLAVILVKTAFIQESWCALFKHTLFLYILSSFFSGLLTLLCSLLKNPILYTYNGVIYADVSPLLIAVLSVISYSGIRVYEYFTRRRAAQNYEYRLFLDDGNGLFQCRALFDTGLHLTEPFSGKAVILVEKETLIPFLSKKTLEALDMTTAAGLSFRLIPYRSVGGEGLLPAFLPKRLFIQPIGGKKRDISGIYVAVTNGLNRGEYKALVGVDTVGKG